MLDSLKVMMKDSVMAVRESINATGRLRECETLFTAQEQLCEIMLTSGCNHLSDGETSNGESITVEQYSKGKFTITWRTLNKPELSYDYLLSDNIYRYQGVDCSSAPLMKMVIHRIVEG